MTRTKLYTIKDALLERIGQQIDKQTAKGVVKYGHTLDSCPNEKYEWLEMANQELIDLAQYQQKEIRRLRQENIRLEAFVDVCVKQ
ncbi:hypothetical protein [Sporosarcina sp. OR05]|uniref:hypothetical protein n=1 Tax=Sporosarcina sp. OR05 TaxID=2969819 RepID=UPI003529ECA3